MDILRRDMCSRAWFKGLYALVKDIYRLAEAFAGMKRMERSSRKGLSPLLAIIIGLVVTIVAGILLAQLYFSYAATISARPAANIEYIDAIDSGTSDYLVINIKNVGNVPIDTSTITIDMAGVTGAECTPEGSGQPGETISVICSGSNYGDVGDLINGTITIGFTDGSYQSYAFAARLRSA